MRLSKFQLPGRTPQNRGQAFSFDIMFALVIFILAFFIFFGYFVLSDEETSDELQEEASIVIDSLAAEETTLSITDDNVLNETKLESLLSQNYSTIKEELRIENDFCIYLEDENGNLVPINGSIVGVGSSSINLSGVPCLQR